MVVPVESSEPETSYLRIFLTSNLRFFEFIPRGLFLSLLWHDWVLAERAPGCLLPVVILRAIDLLLVVGDEGDVDHVPLADDADEAVRMVAGPGYPHHFTTVQLIPALWTTLLSLLLLVAILTEDGPVSQGIAGTVGGLAAPGTLVSSLL